MGPPWLLGWPKTASPFLGILMLEARDVGRAIRELRSERSQVSLAEEVGITHLELESYEEGEEMPPRDLLASLIEAFGVSEPEFDLRVVDYWRRRIGEELPGTLEAKRVELFEHINVLGLRMNKMVRTLDDMAALGVLR